MIKSPPIAKTAGLAALAGMLVLLWASGWGGAVAGWLHRGFLTVYLDAESFVTGCF